MLWDFSSLLSSSFPWAETKSWLRSVPAASPICDHAPQTGTGHTLALGLGGPATLAHCPRNQPLAWPRHCLLDLHFTHSQDSQSPGCVNSISVT